MAYEAEGMAVGEHGYGQDWRRRSRRRIAAAIAAIGIMAASASGLWYAYHAGAKRSGDGDVPLIRADARATRVKPEQPGGMTIPNQSLFVYNPKSEKGQVERLLPEPDAPLPRPVAPPPAPAPDAAPAAGPPAVSAAGPEGAPPAASVSPGAPPAAPSVGETAVAPPVPIAPPAPPPPAPAVKGGYRVQLAALRSEAAAKEEWMRLKQRNADLLGPLGVTLSKSEPSERGTFWRIRAGPIADAGRAEHICGELKKRNIGCILVRP